MAIQMVPQASFRTSNALNLESFSFQQAKPSSSRLPHWLRLWAAKGVYEFSSPAKKEKEKDSTVAGLLSL